MQKIKKIRRYIIKDIRNNFRLGKENEAIKDKTIKDIRNLSKHGKKIITNQWEYIIFGEELY